MKARPARLTAGLSWWDADVCLIRFGGLLVCAAVLVGCAMISPPVSEGPRARLLVSQVAYVGSDDQVYVAAADGTGARRITQPGMGLSTDQDWVFRWPTYSPDGRRLALAGYRSRAGALLSAALLVADIADASESAGASGSASANQTAASALLESSDLVPIYLYWSPDSRHLSVLMQHAQTLELHLLDVTGQEPSTLVLSGQAVYWSWAPDGRSLAVHLGDGSGAGGAEWVGVLHLDAGGVREERFGDAPGLFRAPAWSPDGQTLAYAVLGGGTTILTARDVGGATTRLAAGSVNVAFNWAPSGGWLAFAFGSPDTPGVYDGVELIRADGTQRHRISQEPLLAFAWSPDGQQLALVTVDEATQALGWSVVGLDGKSRRLVGSFVPTGDAGFQMSFFDQYAQSSSIWSADGRRLVYGAQGGGERSNGTAAGERLMVVDADGQTSPRMVGRGSVGVWSPPRAP